MQGIREEVGRAADGESAAISRLYEAFAPALLRRLRARFGNQPGLDPEDLLQDTFLYALSRDGHPLRRFLRQPRRASSAAEALHHFLWNAACGVASNRRRSVLRHPTAALDTTPERTMAHGGEAPALARDALTRLAACVAESGDAHQLYFQLRYVDGLTPAEVVHATGWSRKKTYKLKQRLDDALDHCLEQLGLT